MGNNLAGVLEDCIVRLRRGESIEDCLARYPEMRSQLEPRLNMVNSVYRLPGVTPSAKFRSAARARLMSRIWQQSAQERETKAKTGTTLILIQNKI